MSDHALRRIARRILNQPHLISERGAVAVLGALAPRLGVGRLINADGDYELLNLPNAEDKARISLESDQGRRIDAARCFHFDAESGIAVIPIEGELVHRFGHLDPYSGMTGYDGIKMKVQAAEDDPAVKGILLDIDSPGGEVSGCDAAAEAIFAAREAQPIWALINEQATSAAYWLASAAHVVFSPVTGDAGSIGVVTLHVDMSEALEKEGLTVTLIHAGAHKIDGHPFAALPDYVRKNIQTDLTTLHELFAGKVARNRGLTMEAVLATEAEVYMAQDAIAAGLVDAVASEDEVFEEFAAQLARPESTALLPTG